MPLQAVLIMRHVVHMEGDNGDQATDGDRNVGVRIDEAANVRRRYRVRESAARWAIWDIRLDEVPSPTSCENMASNRPLNVTGIPDGRRSSKLTGSA